MSCTLSTNSGSVDSLNVSARCGCKPNRSISDGWQPTARCRLPSNGRPVSGILRSGIQRTFDNLSYLRVRDSSWPTCAIFSSQPVNAILHEPAAPLANCVFVNAEAFGNIFAPQALRAQQNHPASIR